MYVYIYIYTYTYRYIYRERERHTFLYISMYACTYIYIYICIAIRVLCWGNSWSRRLLEFGEPQQSGWPTPGLHYKIPVFSDPAPGKS